MISPDHLALLKRFLAIIWVSLAWLFAWCAVSIMPISWEHKRIGYLVLLGAMLLERLLIERRRRLEAERG